MPENPNPNYDPNVDARDRDQGQPGAMKAAGQVSSAYGMIPTFTEPHIAAKFVDLWNREIGPATGHHPVTGRLRIVLDVSGDTIGVLQLIGEIIPE